MTSWSIPLREVLWEKRTVAPALFTCFCRERNPACPGVLVFLSVLPSQACDRGCGCVVMSGPSVGSPAHLPSQDQPPPCRGPVSFLQPRAQEAPPSRQALVARASTADPWATSTHSPCRNQVNGMSLPLSPKGRPRAACQPGSVSPAGPNDSRALQAAQALCYLPPCQLARDGPFSVN